MSQPLNLLDVVMFTPSLPNCEPRTESLYRLNNYIDTNQRVKNIEVKSDMTLPFTWTYLTVFIQRSTIKLIPMPMVYKQPSFEYPFISYIMWLRLRKGILLYTKFDFGG